MSATGLTGECPAIPALQGGVKGDNIKETPCRKALPFRTESFTKRSFLWCLFFCLVIALAVGLRAYSLDVDQDIRISGDLGLFTDEGLYSLSARNLALFGRFNPNPKNRVVEAVDYPLFTFTQYLSFRTLGITIKALRIPSLIFGIITILVVFFLVSSLFNVKAGTLAAVLMSLNYLLIQYNRLALIENLLSLLLLLSVSVYILRAPRGYAGFLSGIFFGLALITKGTALFYLPAIAGSIFFLDMGERTTGKRLTAILYFFVAVGAVILLRKIYLGVLLHTGWIGPNPNVTSVSLTQTANQLFEFHSIIDWLRNLTQVLISRFSLSMAPVFYLVYFYSFWFLSKIARPLSRSSKVQLAFMAMIASPLISISFFSYNPNRYLIPTVPFFCMLAAIGLVWIGTRDAVQDGFRTEMRVAVAGLGVFFITFRLARVGTVLVNVDAGIATLLLAAVAAVLVSVLIWKRKAFFARIPGGSRYWIPLFLFAVVATTGYQYGTWISGATSNIRNGNKSINGLVKGGVIGGQYAPILGFSSNNILLPLHKRANQERLRQLNLTHYLDAVQHKPNDDYLELSGLDPHFLDHARLIAELPIGFTTASFYELSWGK